MNEQEHGKREPGSHEPQGFISRLFDASTSLRRNVPFQVLLFSLATAYLTGCTGQDATPTQGVLPGVSIQGFTETAPATKTPTPTEFVPTFTPTVTETPLPTETPIPDFYRGLAPSLEQFTELKSKDDISKIIAYLRSKPSLLTDGSGPIYTTIGQSNSITIDCNRDGRISCTVAASVKIYDQGQWRWLYIVEMRNGDGSRGYLTGYFYDGVEMVGKKAYERLLAYAPGENYVWIIIRTIYPVDQKLVYATYLDAQPGVQDWLKTLLETKTIPPELEDTIIPTTN